MDSLGIKPDTRIVNIVGSLRKWTLHLKENTLILVHLPPDKTQLIFYPVLQRSYQLQTELLWYLWREAYLFEHLNGHTRWPQTVKIFCTIVKKIRSVSGITPPLLLLLMHGSVSLTVAPFGVAAEPDVPTIKSDSEKCPCNFFYDFVCGQHSLKVVGHFHM